MKAIWISKEKHKEMKLLAVKEGVTMTALFEKMYEKWSEEIDQEVSQQEN